MKWLSSFNLGGVLALVVLCVVQWRTDGRLNRRRLELEEIETNQARLIAEKGQRIKGDAADLDELRQRLTLAESQLTAMTRERDTATAQARQLVAERDRLKEALGQWQAATAARDAATAQLSQRLSAAVTDRNAAVQKFNDLAAKYNDLVGEVNKRRAMPATSP